MALKCFETDFISQLKFLTCPSGMEDDPLSSIELPPLSKKDTPASEGNPALRSLLSGAGAGVVCTLLCAPLDVTKVRMQVQGSLGGKRYSGGVFASIQKIYIEEGLKGVFKGVGPALVTVPLFWGVYWPIYDRMKVHLEEKHPSISTPMVHILSAVMAGATGDIITNPFWVTRTRIQTLALHPSENISSEVSTYQMMKIIQQNEGWRAFYKGLGASFLGLSHVAIQFPLYEYLKRTAKKGEDRPETFLELLVSSTVAKLVASSITYPHEVLRARLQDGRGILYHKHGASSGSSGSAGANSGNVNVLSAAMASKGPTLGTTAGSATYATARVQVGLVALCVDIIKREGVLSLWSGIRVSMFRVVPATASTFLAYEYISRYLKESHII